MIRTLVIIGAVLGWSGAALAQEGDPAQGEQAFRQCGVCHVVGPGAANRVGPQLNGIVGRQIGTAEGYNYGPATKARGEDGTVWTEQLLFEYLADPPAFVGGPSKMPMKYADEALRRNVIAYLAQFDAEGNRSQ